MRFLFTVWPFQGCVHPLVAVANEVKALGHEVGFYTGKAYRPLIERQGFRLFPFQDLPESLVADLVCTPDGIGRNWTRPWKLHGQLQAFFVDSIPAQFSDMRRILDSWKPHGVITDPAMLAPVMLLAETDPVPVAICSYAAGCMLKGPGIPPLGLGLPLPRTLYRKIANEVLDWGAELFLSGIRRRANQIRQSQGLAVVKGPIIELAAKLPLYLLPSCREFDYNRTGLPASVHYVGPLQWYPPAEPPAWLKEMPADQPMIHVTEGTLHFQEPFLLKAGAEGLAGLPMRVVITTGDDRDPARLGFAPLAPNVRVERWVSHKDLLPRTAVMVATAGGGTTMAALKDGVPMVLTPTEWDKADNARRVVEAGAGVIVPRHRCTPANIRKAVEHVLAEPYYRANARRIADIMAGLGGPVRAAELVVAMPESR